MLPKWHKSRAIGLPRSCHKKASAHRQGSRKKAPQDPSHYLQMDWINISELSKNKGCLTPWNIVQCAICFFRSLSLSSVKLVSLKKKGRFYWWHETSLQARVNWMENWCLIWQTMFHICILLNRSTIRIYLGCKVTDNYWNQQIIAVNFSFCKPLNFNRLKIKNFIQLYSPNFCTSILI